MSLRFVLLAAGLALSGCKTGLDANIFTTDVLAVSDTGKPLDTTATISIDATSEDQCAKFKDAIGKALLEGFSKAEFLECRKIEMTTVADFRVTIPMTAPQAAFTSALNIWAGELNGKIGVVLKPDFPRIDKIKAALPQEVTAMMGAEIEPQISLTITNDGTDPAKITMQGAFIDGKPYQLPETFEVSRRDELRIVLSDVGNAAFNNGGSLLFFMKP